MAYRPGDAFRRPHAGNTFSISSPAMEEAARHLRSTAVLVTLAEDRVDISPQLVAKAIERELRVPFDQMHVSKHHLSISW